MPPMSESTRDAHSTDRPGGMARIGWIAGPLLLAALLVAIAVVMVGPAPRPADEGLPTSPPPLALPSDVPGDGPVARAAARLATGDLDAARAAFIDIVAEDRDGEVGQVGLVLSRWRTTGPISVERDLRQLVREYPDSAFVTLHLGMVQVLLDEPRASRRTLREAIELGQAAADPTSLRMARLARDLLTPEAFRGDMPVLVAPSEVRPADRADLRQMLDAVGSGDRLAAADLAARLERSPDPMGRIAALVATFDKSDPDPTVERLETLSRQSDVPRAAADRARMLAALATAWGGGERDEACAGLRAGAGASVDAATRRLAGPIADELCA
jgi:hypothetical protein